MPEKDARRRGRACREPRDGVIDQAIDWPTVRRLAEHRAVRVARRNGWDCHLAEDVAQEALVRLWSALRAHERILDQHAWIDRVVVNISSDAARRRPSAGVPLPGLSRPNERLDSVAAGSSADPEALSALRDLWDHAPALLNRLPPPCHEIATLQYLLGWTTAEITRWLGTWRPIGRDEAHRLILRAHAMLRALGRSQDPDRLWPTGRSPKKNAWLTTHPPPFARLTTQVLAHGPEHRHDAHLKARGERQP